MQTFHHRQLNVGFSNLKDFIQNENPHTMKKIKIKKEEKNNSETVIALAKFRNVYVTRTEIYTAEQGERQRTSTEC